MTEVDITLNGKARKLPPGQTVAAILVAIGEDPEGVGFAVAVNEEVVHRAVWSQTEVRDGDSVEVVRAIQGG